MNEQSILEDLLAILENNGVAIRHEQLGGSGGGLCKMKGQNIFFVDMQASSADMAVLCAQAVTGIIDIENLYLRPQVREFIENCCREAT